MQSKYEIREFTSKEIESVARLYTELAYYVQQESSDIYYDFKDLTIDGLCDYLKGTLNNEKNKIFVVEYENAVIGFINGEIIDNFLPISSIKKVGYINGCFIKEKHRMHGLTKLLMKHIDQFFKESEIKYVELNYMLGNDTAEKTWTSLGFSTFRFQMRKKI
jgi:hypothetical protein